MIDIKKILIELQNLPNYDDQIMLQTIENETDPFYGIGKLNAIKHSEKDFKIPLFDIPYINSLINDFGLFRTRVMKLKSRTCYTYHRDPTPRLHIPIITNKKCFFIIDKEVIHLPADGNYYIIDTTKPHTALNASWEERIHIVGCIND